VVASRKGLERAKIPPFPEAELTVFPEHTGPDRGPQHLLIGGAVEQLALLAFQGAGPVPAALIETAKVTSGGEGRSEARATPQSRQKPSWYIFTSLRGLIGGCAASLGHQEAACWNGLLREF
jgi:hypothetical protein